MEYVECPLFRGANNQVEGKRIFAIQFHIHDWSTNKSTEEMNFQTNEEALNVRDR